MTIHNVPAATVAEPRPPASGEEYLGERWWQWAACAGRDPAWWSEERPMWPSAVRLCLSCPVRDRCLDEAVRQRDNGVIRGGMLLVDTSRGYSVVPLICANCGLRPVRLTAAGGLPRYCGRTCQLAGRRSRAGGRTAARRPPARGAPAAAHPGQARAGGG